MSRRGRRDRNSMGGGPATRPTSAASSSRRRSDISDGSRPATVPAWNRATRAPQEFPKPSMEGLVRRKPPRKPQRRAKDIRRMRVGKSKVVEEVINILNKEIDAIQSIDQCDLKELFIQLFDTQPSGSFDPRKPLFSRISTGSNEALPNHFPSYEEFVIKLVKQCCARVEGQGSNKKQKGKFADISLEDFDLEHQKTLARLKGYKPKNRFVIDTKSDVDLKKSPKIPSILELQKSLKPHEEIYSELEFYSLIDKVLAQRDSYKEELLINHGKRSQSFKKIEGSDKLVIDETIENLDKIISYSENIAGKDRKTSYVARVNDPNRDIALLLVHCRALKEEFQGLKDGTKDIVNSAVGDGTSHDFPKIFRDKAVRKLIEIGKVQQQQAKRAKSSRRRSSKKAEDELIIPDDWRQKLEDAKNEAYKALSDVTNVQNRLKSVTLAHILPQLLKEYNIGHFPDADQEISLKAHFEKLIFELSYYQLGLAKYGQGSDLALALQEEKEGLWNIQEGENVTTHPAMLCVAALCQNLENIRNLYATAAGSHRLREEDLSAFLSGKIDARPVLGPSGEVVVRKVGPEPDGHSDGRLEEAVFLNDEQFDHFKTFLDDIEGCNQWVDGGRGRREDAMRQGVKLFQAGTGGGKSHLYLNVINQYYKYRVNLFYFKRNDQNEKVLLDELHKLAAKFQRARDVANGVYPKLDGETITHQTKPIIIAADELTHQSEAVKKTIYMIKIMYPDVYICTKGITATPNPELMPAIIPEVAALVEGLSDSAYALDDAQNKKVWEGVWQNYKKRIQKWFANIEESSELGREDAEDEVKKLVPYIARTEHDEDSKDKKIMSLFDNVSRNLSDAYQSNDFDNGNILYIMPDLDVRNDPGLDDIDNLNHETLQQGSVFAQIIFSESYKKVLAEHVSEANSQYYIFIPIKIKGDPDQYRDVAVKFQTDSHGIIHHNETEIITRNEDLLKLKEGVITLPDGQTQDVRSTCFYDKSTAIGGDFGKLSLKVACCVVDSKTALPLPFSKLLQITGRPRSSPDGASKFYVPASLLSQNNRVSKVCLEGYEEVAKMFTAAYIRSQAIEYKTSQTLFTAFANGGDLSKCWQYEDGQYHLTDNGIDIQNRLDKFCKYLSRKGCNTKELVLERLIDPQYQEERSHYYGIHFAVGSQQQDNFANILLNYKDRKVQYEFLLNLQEYDASLNLLVQIGGGKQGVLESHSKQIQEKLNELERKMQDQLGRISLLDPSRLHSEFDNTLRYYVSYLSGKDCQESGKDLLRLAWNILGGLHNRVFDKGLELDFDQINQNALSVRDKAGQLEKKIKDDAVRIKKFPYEQRMTQEQRSVSERGGFDTSSFTTSDDGVEGDGPSQKDSSLSNVAAELALRDEEVNRLHQRIKNLVTERDGYSRHIGTLKLRADRAEADLAKKKEEIRNAATQALEVSRESTALKEQMQDLVVNQKKQRDFLRDLRGQLQEESQKNVRLESELASTKVLQQSSVANTRRLKIELEEMRIQKEDARRREKEALASKDDDVKRQSLDAEVLRLEQEGQQLREDLRAAREAKDQSDAQRVQDKVNAEAAQREAVRQVKENAAAQRERYEAAFKKKNQEEFKKRLEQKAIEYTAPLRDHNADLKQENDQLRSDMDEVQRQVEKALKSAQAAADKENKALTDKQQLIDSHRQEMAKLEAQRDAALAAAKEATNTAANTSTVATSTQQAEGYEELRSFSGRLLSSEGSWISRTQGEGAIEEKITTSFDDEELVKINKQYDNKQKINIATFDDASKASNEGFKGADDEENKQANNLAVKIFNNSIAKVAALPKYQGQNIPSIATNFVNQMRSMLLSKRGLNGLRGKDNVVSQLVEYSGGRDKIDLPTQKIWRKISKEIQNTSKKFGLHTEAGRQDSDGKGARSFRVVALLDQNVKLKGDKIVLAGKRLVRDDSSSNSSSGLVVALVIAEDNIADFLLTF